jgi:hypothetical protein
MRVSLSRIGYANRVTVRYWYAGTFAYALFRQTGTINDGEQVVVGGRTYTFQTVLTNVSGNVLIGSDPLGNLNAAINLAGGAGTSYAAATTANSAVGSSVFTSDALQVKALTVGLSGNSIACTTTCANADWIWEGAIATITLKGGLDAGVGNSIVRDEPTQQAAYGVYGTIVEAPNVFTASDAAVLGDALLTTLIVVQKTVTYQTMKSGLFPGMLQSIQRANRNINESCLITQVNSTWREGTIVERNVTAVGGLLFKGDRWRDQYRKWAGGGGGGTTISGGVPPSGGGGIAGTIYFLGGTPEAYVQSPVPTWIPASVDGGVEYVIDTAVRGSLIGTVRALLRAQSGSVTARLWDIDAATAVGASVAITSTTFVPVVFAVTLISGADRYRLELLPSLADVDVNGVGYLV